MQIRKIKLTLIFFIIIMLFVVAILMTGCSSAYKLNFSSDEYTIISGIEFSPEIKIRPKNMAYELFSENLTIAKIVDNKIISIKEGKTKITVRSGDKEDTAILYVDNDIDFDNTNVKFAEICTISFVIVNYELAFLPSENYGSPLTVLKNDYANFDNDPYLSGYYIDFWYTDRECTVVFDAENAPITSDLTLYAQISERETAYSISNGIVTGLVYPNIPHTVLNLPEIDKNGEEVIGIKDGAFKGDTTITKVNMPCTYLTVGDNAFAGCKNLNEINIIGGQSKLEVIGVNAFGILYDDNGKEKYACEKLQYFDLPDSIYEIGGYAFYKCYSLVLDGIPSSLTVIKPYSFAYSKVNNIDFKNISEIGEYAFYNCSILDNVQNTKKIEACKAKAFVGTKLFADQKQAYLNSEQDSAKAVFYADTIVIGTPDKYGYSYGDGTLVIGEKATLIADEAFKGTDLKELYVYITTANAARILDDDNYNFIGQDIFYGTLGAHIIVPENLESKYKEKYPALNSYIGYTTAVEIKSGINKGIHTVFLSRNINGKTADYLHYSGEGIKIDLNLIAENFNLTKWRRIALGAFSNNSTVSSIDMGRVEYVANLAVTSGMKKLKSIYLTSCTTPPELESSLSLQLNSELSPSIYVKSGDLRIYRTEWSEYNTIKSYLKAND